MQALAGFAGRNRSQITQTGRLVVYSVLVAVLSMAALALAVRLSRPKSRDRLAVVVAVLVGSFLNFSALFDPNPRDTAKLVAVLVFWLLLTALLARVAFLVGGNANVRLAALVFAATMFGMPALSYGAHVVGDEQLMAIADPSDVTIPEVRPNVYWIILDGYARADVLERVEGIDNGSFVRSLDERGFQVSSSSRASYPRTHLSLASTLEMRYVLEPGHDVRDDFARFGPVVVGHSTTAARFSALGYRTIYGPAGGVEWSACRADLVDACLLYRRPSPATGELEQALLNLTPFGVVSLPVPYADPLTFVNGLEAEVPDLDRPFFAWQHIMTPHEPYRYREDCSARSTPTNRRSLADQLQIRAYRTQITCINDLMLEALDRILERDPSAVIILQSDHGSDFTFSWKSDTDDLSPSQLTERYSVLNAIRLPDGCPVEIEGQPLVNTFRIVFACIEGKDPSLLDYRGFAQPLDDVSDLVELAPERFEG
jgi:hypothetical protein